MNDIPANDNLPLPITGPVTKQRIPGEPREMDAHGLSALARELAIHIKPLDEILREFELTEERLSEIKQIPYFKNCLEAYANEWNSPANTAKRIALKSSMIIEDSLPDIGARMVDPSEPLRDSVEAGKFLAKLGSLGEDKGAGGAGEQVKITINIGNQTLTFDKTPEVQPLPEGSAPVIDLRLEPERDGKEEEIRSEPERDGKEEEIRSEPEGVPALPHIRTEDQK